jgi:uracil-DNA glycosylase
MPVPVATDLAALSLEVAGCRACPRLVPGGARRVEKRRPFVTSVLGPAGPRLRRSGRAVLVVGLAPAATANRTAGSSPAIGPVISCSLPPPHRVREPADVNGRRRTRPAEHVHHRGGALRAAANKPTPAERDECRPYLVRELELLDRIRVIVSLGAFGYEAVWAALRQALELRAPPAVARTASKCRAARHGRRVPPESAEHVHRPADPADARRVFACARARQ